MVAARAGVSTATVSLVANGKTQGRVSEDNISRVREAIAELGYVVDSIGSSLAKGVSSIVILVAPDISNPFFAKVIAGVRGALGAEYQLLLSVTDAGEFPARRRRPQAPGSAAGRAAGGCPQRRRSSRNFPQLGPWCCWMPPAGVLRPLGKPGRRRTAPAELAAHLADSGHKQAAYMDSVTGTATFDIRRTHSSRRPRRAE